MKFTKLIKAENNELIKDNFYSELEHATLELARKYNEIAENKEQEINKLVLKNTFDRILKSINAFDLNVPFFVDED